MSLQTLTRGPLIRAGALVLVVSASLAGCGKLGQLEKPGSLTGQEAPQPPTMQTVDPRDRVTDGPAPTPTPETGPTSVGSAPSGGNATSR